MVMVLYNGGDEWSAVRSFKEYLAEYALFAPYTIDFQYLLVNVNKIPKKGLLGAANVINTVFYLDQQNTLKEFLRKLKQVRKILGKLSADQRVDLMGWLRDVLVKKIRRAHPNTEGLETMIDTFEKGEGDPMVYAIERMIDEIEEKAKETGKEEMIKNLLALGVSVETIQEASGMSLDKIEQLHNENSSINH
jgi:hypothetical protein